MANKITYVFEFDDKGRVKVEGLTKGFIQLETAMKKIAVAEKERQAASNSANKAMQNTISDAGLAGATLTELGRAISDSNYGIRGMANNFSQLSTLFITLVSKRGGGIGGVSLALQQLGRQLLGPLGIILAFQSLIAMLESFAISNDEAKESTENLTQALDEQMIVFDALGKSILQYNLGGKALQRSVIALRSEFKDFAKAYDDLADKSDESVKTLVDQFVAYQNLQKEIVLTKEELKGATVGSREYEIAQNKLTSLIIKRAESEKIFGKQTKKRNDEEKNLIEGSIAFYQAQIAILKKAQSSATDPDSFASLQKRIDQLDDMLDFIKGIREEVDAIIVKTDTRLRIDPKDFVKETKSQKIATDVLKSGLKERQEEFKKYFDNLDLLRQKDTKNTEISEEAKMRAASNTGRAFEAVGGLLQDLAEENKELMIAGIIVEKVGAIAQIIANTAIANAKAVAAFPVAAGQPFVGINTASAAVSIAATTAAAVKAVGAVRSGQDADIGGSATGSSPTGVAPQFNVVGQEVGQMGQLASAITGQAGEPIRAYVVLDDVNSAAELDNKITTSGSIG